jgi:selenocysteine lyase/cysteine desulfurase
MTLDIARLRADTPGVTGVLHFDNAGAALMPTPVHRAVIDHLDLEMSVGGYAAAARREGDWRRFYEVAARLVGGRPEEIAFVENATRSWDMAFYGLAFQPGDRILTARCEYASNAIAFLQTARRTGVSIEAVPNDASGALDVAALERMIDDKVRLIAVTHVPTNGGLVSPAEAIGAVARRHGLPFLLDACQSVGQMPIDVQRIGCTMLSATGRKYLRGPRGTGFLWVARDWIERLEPPMLDLHAASWVALNRYEMAADARRFENWERSYAGKLGLVAAIDYALAVGPEAAWARIQYLAERLRAALADIGCRVHDLGRTRGGIVTFSHPKLPAAALRQALAARAINVTVSTVSSTRFDMTDRGLDAIVRASIHYYNDEDEVAAFVQAVAAA